MQKSRTTNLLIATLAWLATVALVTFGSKHIWNGDSTISLLALLLNLVIGVIMILANRKYVLKGDELEQKIQLESMGITLGLTMVMGIAYGLMDTTNLIDGAAEISYLIIFMGVTYIIAIIFNNRKYR